MHRLDIPWLLEKFNDEEGETCEGVRSRMLSLSHLPSNVSSPLRLFASSPSGFSVRWAVEPRTCCAKIP